MKAIFFSSCAALLLTSCVVQLPAGSTSTGSTTKPSTTPNTLSVEPTPYVTKRESYTGTVGNTKVRAELAFFSNGAVVGNYVSFDSGKKYYLKGDNLFTDKLVLKESSKDKYGDYRETSVSDLRRSSSSSKVWSGTMRNYDGRNVPVKWTRSN